MISVLVGCALPWAGEVESADGISVFVFVFDLEGAEEFLGEMADHLFDEVGHDFEVTEGLVGFEHGELGIVTTGDSFVPEIAIEFEDFCQATDEKALQVQLGSDAHGEWHIQRIVMRLERPRRSAAGHVVKHGCFDFEVAALVEEVANLGDDLRTDDEEVGARLVRHQIEMALAVLCFAIRKSMPLVGHRGGGPLKAW